MKKMKFSVLFIIAGLLLFSSCEDSGSSEDEVNEALSLGDSLIFTGNVDRVFAPPVIPWTTSYSNPGSNDYVLTDESDDTDYQHDDNAGSLVDVNINYAGSPGSSHLYSSGAWPGITSTNPSVDITTIVVEVWTADSSSPTSDDIFLGDFSSSPAKWYYYMYATGQTVLSGTYVDTGDDPDTNHVFDNIKIFEGWNRMLKITTDGVTYTYTSGEISDPHWTFIDNS